MLAASIYFQLQNSLSGFSTAFKMFLTFLLLLITSRYVYVQAHFLRFV